MKVWLSIALTVVLLGLAGPHVRAATLDDVRARGTIRCGVSGDLPGFSSVDDGGVWSGLDADICRAVAAAIFADSTKVEFIPVTAQNRFDALSSKKIDVLARNTTWTLGRDAGEGLNFVGVMYYDGQGFMVPRNLGVSSALELSGARICAQKATTSELNVVDYFQSKGLPFEVVVIEGGHELLRAYEMGRCNVVTADASRLHSLRLQLTSPDEHMVLPETISKEPLAPAVADGDDQWFDVVKWTLFALINAEELRVTSQNVDAMKGTSDPKIRRFLGLEGGLGSLLGLNDDWAYQIVKSVGNYGEIFERNVGQDSPLKITRGLNALWGEGGIQYAPPIR